MKTVSYLEKQISIITEQIIELDKWDDRKSASKSKRLRKKIPELKTYILYLQTNPTKDYCEKEVDRLSGRITEILKLHKIPENHNFTKPQLSAMKKEFEKKWDVLKIRKQLTAMLYILK